MIIQMYKESKLANAPDEIARCINKYTPHTAFLSNEINLSNIDILHFHNKYKKVNYDKMLMQFHSEPEKARLDFPGQKIVITQYHATLSQYNRFYRVRNIIDFEREIYAPKQSDKIRICYSPSTKSTTGWNNKGYHKTKKILERLKEKYKSKIDVHILMDLPYEEVLDIKSKSSIVIDECVTKSYHKNTLEGLAMGKVIICSIGKDVQELIKEEAGDYMPVENVWIDELEDFLEKLIVTETVESLYEHGLKNRKWMEDYWHPRDVLKKYLQIYWELYNA